MIRIFCDRNFGFIEFREVVLNWDGVEGSGCRR